jgi:hypothetical protein
MPDLIRTYLVPGTCLAPTCPARERIDDWRAFLEEGLDLEDHAALRAAERTGRLL